MADKWFAECLPCRWETRHDNQDAAIRCAEDHVFRWHRDVPPAERGLKYMGHVQNRTENAEPERQTASTVLDADSPTPSPLRNVVSIAGDTFSPSDAPVETPGEGIAGNEVVFPWP